RTFDLLEKQYEKEYSSSDLAGFRAGQTNRWDWSHRLGPNPSQPKGSIESLKEDILIGQNTAYVCKGTSILKYHKIGNSAEVNGYGKNIVFAPGNIAGQFLVGDVRYGLEICMDHWLGILKESGAPEVDVQLITSSTTSNRPLHYNIKYGGVVLHASNPPQT